VKRRRVTSGAIWWQVICDDDNNAKRPLKELVRVDGGKAVRAACSEFVQELKEHVMAGVQAPQPKAPPRERFNAGYVASSAETSKTGSVKVTYQYNPPPPVIYDTLLDTQVRGAGQSCAAQGWRIEPPTLLAMPSEAAAATA
jgi:hypothetical protein